MRKKLTIALLLTLFLGTTSAQESYRLDVKKSKIDWKALKTMGNRHYGNLYFNSGNLSFSAVGEPINGSFSLNMNSLTNLDYPAAADNLRVEKELKSIEFFNVANYPSATMNVKRITRSTTASMYKVLGDLTIKGITHAIEFMATIKKKDAKVYVTAETKIDRIKWNIKFQPEKKQWDFFPAIKNKMIADEIPVALNLVFVK